MKITVGIFAHVDAGKTTLAEQILYTTGILKKAGKIEDRNTLFDNNEIEKSRGITIFLGQAEFLYHGENYSLLDTPGHVDFSAEMERSLEVIDIAILVISLTQGIQGHTLNVWKKLNKLQIPTIFFLNKADQKSADLERVAEQMKKKLTTAFVILPDLDTERKWNTILEQAAEENDALLELYLNEESRTSVIEESIWKQIAKAKLFPCICGAALKQKGIVELLESIENIKKQLEEEEKASSPFEQFSGTVYKIQRDEKGDRVVYLKVIRGSISVKEEVEIHNPFQETFLQKINQIRIYSGSKHEMVSKAEKGDICGVLGLDKVKVGAGLGEWKAKENNTIQPVLRVKLIPKIETQKRRLLEALQILEEEEPMLKLGYEEQLEQISISIMGQIQLEILGELLKERFKLDIDFGEYEIQYLETIKEPIMGYGHFEPLRHYAEVHIRIEPGERGSGIQVYSECMEDILRGNYQSLILHHMTDREQKGVLLGAPLTDVKFILVTGRAHLKHTEGGDFREATYRAIRQGLEKAENMILEPMYHFTIFIAEKLTGHVIADIKKMYGEVKEIETIKGETQIIGRCPASTMMNYQKELLIFSKGQGILQLETDGYEVCHNSDEIIKKIAYQKERDVANTSSSVFCSHGSGFVVPWQEVEGYLHCPIL